MHFFPTREVALAIGPLAIHWYGLMYLLGFVVGAWLLPRLQHFRSLNLSRQQQDSFILFIAIGVIAGGRLGEVFLWDASYYLSHPWEILAVWKGGMSSHGGFIGVILMGLLFCRRESIDPWKIGDIIVIPLALGLAFGRIGNFINQELYGTVTTLPWGMYFDGVEGLRHPVQLYAVIKDLFIASVCTWYLMHSVHRKPGFNIGIFLTLYGILRFLLEYVRDQEGYEPYHLGSILLTQGQALTIPILLAGMIVAILRSGKKSEGSSQ